jgi:HNH endonuclease
MQSSPTDIFDMRSKKWMIERVMQLEAKLSHVAVVPTDPSYSVGQLGATLGLRATTPCVEVSRDSRLIRRYMMGERPGAVVCHRCDNPACVAVDHLFWGTPRDNARDTVLKGRRRVHMRARWAVELAALRIAVEFGLTAVRRYLCCEC